VRETRCPYQAMIATLWWTRERCRYLPAIIATLESSDLMAGKVNRAPEDNVGHPSSTKAQGRDTQKARHYPCRRVRAFRRPGGPLPGHERAREGGIPEVNRKDVIRYPARPRRRHGQPGRTAVAHPSRLARCDEAALASANPGQTARPFRTVGDRRIPRYADGKRSDNPKNRSGESR